MEKTGREATHCVHLTEERGEEKEGDEVNVEELTVQGC